MNGTKRVVVLVWETESMHKFRIILDFQLILRGSITVRFHVILFETTVFTAFSEPKISGVGNNI